MTDNELNASPEQEPNPAASAPTSKTPYAATAPDAALAPASTESASLPTQPAYAAHAPARSAPSFWRRTGIRVAAGVVAAVVLLLVGFGSGWLVRGELHRAFGVTAPGPDAGHDRGGMPGGGMPGMRDHDGDGFGGQLQDGDDDDQSTPDQQSTPDEATPDSSPNS
ncbi:hypothetical protein AB0N64_08725 [Microbacterium sp. NPDC089318]